MSEAAVVLLQWPGLGTERHKMFGTQRDHIKSWWRMAGRTHTTDVGVMDDGTQHRVEKRWRVRGRQHANNRWWCYAVSCRGCDSCLSAGSPAPPSSSFFLKMEFIDSEQRCFWFDSSPSLLLSSLFFFFFLSLRLKLTEERWWRSRV